MRRWQLEIDDTGSVEGIYAFIYCKKWRSGQVLLMRDSLTDSQRKDRATQLLIKYKSGALVTQLLQGFAKVVIYISCALPKRNSRTKNSTKFNGSMPWVRYAFGNV